MPKALIIGSEGQDGKLLSLLLTSKGYSVFGVGKSQAQKANYLSFDLADNDFNELEKYILDIRPDEIYYVAAFHHSSQEKKNDNFEFIDRSVRVNQIAFMKLLELCRNYLPACKIAYTSSSLIFSGSEKETHDEQTVTAPRCIYSVTKCAAMEAAKFYRSEYGLFVSVGIMYNHESMFRNDHFLSKKIVNETRQFIEGKISSIRIGDLSSITDWGYAPDYVEALWHMLQLETPTTFIVSSGKPHKVQDWFEVLAAYLDFDWKKLVVEDKTMIVRKKPVLIGDNSKLVNSGWKAQTGFNEMVIKMYNNVL